jgi:2-amino-4-hydroxy-6-hydroxymethyldihydropteridine diphosphokinase
MKIDTTTEGASRQTRTDAPPPRVLLMLGSNVNAEQQLDAALRLLAGQFDLIQRSARHWTAAAGNAEAPAYLNQAVVIRSELGRERLREALRALESGLGRQRPSPQPGLCAIDIDAVGRWSPEFEVWDTKSYTAQYAQRPLRDIASEGI